MRIKISVLILILSFINMEVSATSENSAFLYIENIISQESVFVSNSVKINYDTSNDMNIEAEKIKKILGKHCSYIEKIESNGQNMIFTGSKSKVNVNLWNKNKRLYVEIVFYNTDAKLTTLEILNLINNIKDKKMNNIQYYYLYKGKINEPVMKRILNKKLFQNVEMLSITNGLTGVADYKNQKINFAEVKYDTGSYIIIASPIIFITY